MLRTANRETLLDPVTAVKNSYPIFMQNARDIKVTALWDDEAGVWVATSDQVPGLVTEAENLEVLLDELRSLVPELPELNGVTARGDLTREAHRRKELTRG